MAQILVSHDWKFVVRMMLPVVVTRQATRLLFVAYYY